MVAFVPRLPVRRPRASRLLAGGTALVCAGLAWSVPPAVAQQAPTTTTQQDLVGRLQGRVGELERLVQELTGRVEEALYQNRQLQERLTSSLGDVEYRLDALEGNPTSGGAAAKPGTRPVPAGTGTGTGMAAGSGVLTAPGKQPPAAAAAAPSVAAKPGASASAAPTASATLPEGSEPDQYNFAFSLLRNADYPAAEQALKSFIQKYPKGKLTGNAQYWLGETYYARGDYEQAAVTFMTGYQSFPDSSKGPDNLLKLGLALSNLGKTREACAAFGRLEGQYPKASDAIKRRAQSEIGRLGC